jgi:hypothetical protein
MLNMTIPEWAAIILVTCVIGILAYGAKRVINIGDEQSKILSAIRDDLSDVSIKLAQAEVWMKMHEKEDARMFQMIGETHKDLWDAINERGGKTRRQPIHHHLQEGLST